MEMSCHSALPAHPEKKVAKTYMTSFTYICLGAVKAKSENWRNISHLISQMQSVLFFETIESLTYLVNPNLLKFIINFISQSFIPGTWLYNYESRLSGEIISKELL